MNIAFHINQIDLRGTSTTVYDYAFYNELLLKNKSFIISGKNSSSSSMMENFLKEKFKTFIYDDFNQVPSFVKENNIELIHYIKSGEYDGKLIDGVKNAIHVVFQRKDIHGEVYAYVSEWLSDVMSNGQLPFVPHIIDMPYPTRHYRRELGVPDDAIVFGRYGGNSEFDLPFVHQAVIDVAQKNTNIYFLFMNTNRFSHVDIKNIFYIAPAITKQQKADFINTCDAMIHGRRMGESFGLSICEFLDQGRPIITWEDGIDKNHAFLLKDKGLYYSHYQDVYVHLSEFKKPTEKEKEALKQIVEPFKPEIVMKKFKEVFI